MSLKISKLDGMLYKYLYWIILSTFLLSMFSNIERVLINGAIILVIDIQLIKSNGFNLKKNEISQAAFIIYCIFSFVVFISNGYPIYIFLSSFVGSVLPIILMFCRNIELYEEYFENTYKALVVSFVISLLLHILTPSFYCNYLYNKGYININNTFWAKYFFQGIFGVTALGTLSACASLFFLCKFIDNKRTSTLLLMGLSMLSLFVTRRRSAIAAFLLGTVFIILFTNIQSNTKRSRKMYFLGIVIILMLIIIIVRNLDYFINVINLVTDISGAINERNEGWYKNIRSLGFFDLFFGTGLGSRSHTAFQYGYMAVTDSSYIQLFCELGIVGISLLILMILNFVINIRLKDVNYSYLSAVLVVFVYLIQAVGSNVFEFQATAPLFWISMGYCIHYKSRR